MRVSWGEGGCRGITVSSYVCECRAVLLHCVCVYGIRMEVKMVLHRVWYELMVLICMSTAEKLMRMDGHLQVSSGVDWVLLTHTKSLPLVLVGKSSWPHQDMMCIL